MFALENVVRALLREEGLKAGKTSGRKFTDTVRELAGTDQALSAIVSPMLDVLVTMQRQLADLTSRVVAIAGADPVCRRLMGVPGMGAITTLTFVAAVDRPDRFRQSRTLGAHLGLTPKRYQSGETDIAGRISKCGDGMARSALFEAAHVLLVLTRKPSSLKAWGLAVAKRRGLNRARVAVARKLAVILHRMWEDGTDFIWSAKAAASQTTTAPEPNAA
jgi:transposase